MPRVTRRRSLASPPSSCPYRMNGKAMKIPTSTASLPVRDAPMRRTFRARLSGSRLAPPAITKGREILDLGKVNIKCPELVSDALYQGAHVGAVTVVTITCDKSFVVNTIIDRAIGHILSGTRCEEIHDVELCQGKSDIFAI